MAQTQGGDLLMMVLPQRGGRPVPGESNTALEPPGPLLRGFRKGFTFEITNFKFAIQTTKPDAAAAGKPAPGAGPGRAAAPQHPTAAAPAKKGEAQSCPVQPITFERPIDAASAALLKHCVDCDTLYGAVVVKRKPAGGSAAGEVYLRMEFIGILFTNIQWANGDIVTESCTFITRSVNVKYRPQLPDGSLGAVINGVWSRIPNRTEELVV